MSRSDLSEVKTLDSIVINVPQQGTKIFKKSSQQSQEKEGNKVY